MTRIHLPVITGAHEPHTSTPPPARALRVALVNMPWARVDTPSIQCGLLQSIARDAGHHCDVHYLNLELAAVVGSEVYDGVADIGDERLHQLGEWVFSYAAFGEVRPEAAYFEEFPEVPQIWRELTGQDVDDLVRFRRETLPAWLAGQVDGIELGRYDVVGFSSTFLQNTASLALGRLLKERHPAVQQIYGGANFDGEMGLEYFRHLPWIDHVVTGEGDRAFPALLHRIAAGHDTPIAGVHSQVGPRSGSEAGRSTALDELPVPDYEDYFTTLARLGADRVLGETPPKLLVEFSRGCWWGAKHHCTFCGLNALGMNYRAKSSSRALSELEELLRRHHVEHVEAVDNILDMNYVRDFCTELAAQRWDLQIFFEVKANLTRDQLAILAAAGIKRIQPGIESLSTHVLELMRKGSTKLINARLLKWARYHDISVEWNILNGFPGEDDADYDEQRDLFPLLHHLQPPLCGGQIWLERFSPYFTDPDLAMDQVRPRSCYEHLYPAAIDAAKVAYFFDYADGPIATEPARTAMAMAANEWRAAWRRETRPTLTYRRAPDRLTITDRRGEHEKLTELEGWRADSYEACGDTARNPKRIHQQLLDAGHHTELAQLEDFLAECDATGLTISENGKYLALALPENRTW
jgi:ribosomal peptide maturation radical SAM protein 1